MVYILKAYVRPGSTRHHYMWFCVSSLPSYPEHIRLTFSYLILVPRRQCLASRTFRYTWIMLRAPLFTCMFYPFTLPACPQSSWFGVSKFSSYRVPGIIHLVVGVLICCTRFAISDIEVTKRVLINNTSAMIALIDCSVLVAAGSVFW